ncbi:MAG: YbfB/YjiJ family MFS transporter [Acetobacteraceae bacterium]
MSLSVLRPAFSAAAATCSGNGLARFAFVPLFPALVHAGWVTGGQAAALGAAALGGYLVGTLMGRPMALRIGVPRTLDVGMAVIVTSLVACIWNGGFWWLMVWRALAGVGGGLVMALAGPASQASVPPRLRGVAGGIVLAGIGTGIAGGALLVPAAAPFGIAATWAVLAGTVALLWIGARLCWPALPLASHRQTDRVPPAFLLLATYGLHSAGMVPPMVYLADLAARGRGLGVTAGSMTWLVFGTVGVAGGLLSGHFSDRHGGRTALVVWMAVQTVALGLCLPAVHGLIWLAAATAGFAAVGVSTIALAVAREMAPDHAVQLWVRCTAMFGIVQTVVAFALAALFAWTGENHHAVFMTGLAFSVLGMLTAVVLRRQSAA